MNALPSDFNFILVPGLGGSSEQHWQSLWAKMNKEMIMVRQREWDRPNMQDWVNTLVEEVESYPRKPIILVAHSLACTTIIHAVAEKGLEVAGAFMVAPADSERADFPKDVNGFVPIPRVVLPFPSIVVASENDAWCSIEKAQKMANWTQSKFVNIGKKGHVTAADGVGLWETGFNLLLDFADLARS